MLVHVPRGTLEHFPKSNGLHCGFKTDFVETKLDKRRKFIKHFKMTHLTTFKEKSTQVHKKSSEHKEIKLISTYIFFSV